MIFNGEESGGRLLLLLTRVCFDSATFSRDGSGFELRERGKRGERRKYRCNVDGIRNGDRFEP
jgi:hypothetical protein